MKNSQVIDSGWSCNHCGRAFVRESTLLKHLCEQKRRWLDRERPGNRIGYSTWVNYYSRYHPGKKNTAYTDFISSTYYTAFVKFGGYCAGIGVLNPGLYADWLVKNSIPIDTWTSDSTYTKYLVEYLRNEDPYEAVKRSIKNLLDLASAENLELKDVFQYCSRNKVCHFIVNGKISPWLLYHSSAGWQFLTGLTQDHTNLIFEYIDPEKWNIKFKREAQVVNEVKSLLAQIPL